MLKVYRQLEPREFIVVGVDTSAGMGDYCAAQFISKTKIDIPIVYHSKQTATVMTNELVPILNKIQDITGISPVIAYERANGGAFEMDRLAAMNRLGKYRIFRMPSYGRDNPPDSVKLGWDTNTATRPIMLQDLKNAVDKKVIKIYDKPTITELYSFVVVQTTSAWKAQAEIGAHDDLIFGLAIAWQLYQSENPPATEADISDIPDDTTMFSEGGFY